MRTFRLLTLLRLGPCSYPILLIFEFFLGRRFEQLRVAFPLVRWRRLPTPRHTPPAFLAQADALSLARQLAPRPPKVKFLPAGEVLGPAEASGGQVEGQGQEGAGEWVYLVGTEEGGWLRGWEVGVQEGVRRGVRGRALGVEEREAVVGQADARGRLRGYL